MLAFSSSKNLLVNFDFFLKVGEVAKLEGGRGRIELIYVKEKFGPERVYGWWRRGGESEGVWRGKRIGAGGRTMNSFPGRLFI